MNPELLAAVERCLVLFKLLRRTSAGPIYAARLQHLLEIRS